MWKVCWFSFSKLNGRSYFILLGILLLMRVYMESYFCIVCVFLMVFFVFKLNLPFYLHKGLSKMANFYHGKQEKLERSLFHHGLIFILVRNNFFKSRDSWDSFLHQNCFEKPHAIDRKELPPRVLPSFWAVNPKPSMSHVQDNSCPHNPFHSDESNLCDETMFKTTN